MTFRQAQAFGIDDAVYGEVAHPIAPGESVLVEWSDYADIVGVWPPGNVSVASNLPITFPSAHPAHVEASMAVIGSDPSGVDTATVELLINGVVVAGGPQTQSMTTSTSFFSFTEPSFTAVIGTGPQIRVTNDSATFDIFIGDGVTEFASSMNVYDDFAAGDGSGRRSRARWMR